MIETDMIIDTHAHYDDEAFNDDRDELLQSFCENGICRVIDAAADVKSLDDVMALCEKYPFIYGTIGIHPDNIGEVDDAVFEKISKYCDYEKTVAVGEVGLDYHWNKENKSQQIEMFGRFADLAREKKLPLVIHSRDAAEDTLNVIKDKNIGDIGAVMHCYSYSPEMAKQLLDMGLYFGIGGVATFKNARKLVEAIKYLPLASLLLETDCPYLAPVPHRGERNCSLYIPFVVRKIAEIKNVSEEDVIRQTNENARKLFTKLR